MNRKDNFSHIGVKSLITWQPQVQTYLGPLPVNTRAEFAGQFVLHQAAVGYLWLREAISVFSFIGPVLVLSGVY